MEAKNTPIRPQMLVSSKKLTELSSSMLPTIIIPLIALVTLIKGVCKAGVTFQITIYPMNIARMKMKKRFKRTVSFSVAIPKSTKKAINALVVSAVCLKGELTHY